MRKTAICKWQNPCGLKDVGLHSSTLSRIQACLDVLLVCYCFVFQHPTHEVTDVACFGEYKKAYSKATAPNFEE